jgi:hypothetical protein
LSDTCIRRFKLTAIVPNFFTASSRIFIASQVTRVFSH